MDNNKHIVISLGGSIIAPDSIDSVYIKEFTNLIKSYISNGYSFAIITGGGYVARQYIESAKSITSPTNNDLDFIGIASTRLNAELVRTAFGSDAYEQIIMNPDSVPLTDKKIIVGGGWKPGNSSDLAAVHVAKSVGSSIVLNLSNIDFAYDKDPKKDSGAMPIHAMNWADFRKILPTEWQPGLNTPFDPIAAAKAEEMGIEVAIMNGRNIENLKNYLDGKDFIGTKITK